MNLINVNSENILLAAEVIRKGGLVAFPTETVYGLGADGLNPVAVAKIFEAKKRPAFNPLILHISNKEQLKMFSSVKNEKVDRIINKFWPGPLTLVLEKKEIVPDIVTAGNTTVAVRMPNHPVALELIEKSGTPIAAPSANKFGHLSPTTASHVSKYLGDKVDLILDGGKSAVGVESTILQFFENEFHLLRPGGLSKEDIEKEIGKIKTGKTNSVSPNSPGQLSFHYSPQTPLKFFDKKYLDDRKKIGMLYFKSKRTEYSFAAEKILSERGDMREAAANLFIYLHELEKCGLDLILVEPVKEEGLGLAIMDRLIKASKKSDV